MAHTTGGRFEPNAYHLLLLQCILRIKAGIPHTKTITRADCELIDEKTNLGPKVVPKIFGLQYPSDSSVDIFFNLQDNATFYKKTIGSTRSKFYEDIAPDFRVNNEMNIKSHIPKTYPSNIESSLRYKIAQLVEYKLKNSSLATKDQIDGMDIYSIAETKPILEEIPERLKIFLNTRWYMYLYFPGRKDTPRIIRTVFKIHDNPNNVQTEAPKKSGITNDYSCRIRLDKSEQVMIVDGKTLNEGARALHMMIVIGNRESLPEIMLGEYNNIEPTAARIHAIRFVLVYAGNSDDKTDLIPREYSYDSPHWEEIYDPIKEYIKTGRHNFRITPEEAIFTLSELEIHLGNIRRQRYENKNARIQHKLKVAVSMPRYNIDNKTFESYRKPIAAFINHLEKKTQDYELSGSDYFLKEKIEKLLYPRDFDYHIRRVDNCDILLVFCPTEEIASECVAELALAIQSSKAIYLIAPNEQCVPRIYRRGNQPRNLLKEYYGDYADLNTLDQYLIDSAPYSAESGLLNYRILNRR
ncbi:MAG: hypothetical protein AAF741_06140 [Bacteroidota bacterium]